MRIEDKEYNKQFDVKIWKNLFPLLKPYQKLVWIILAGNVICALVDIALPLFQRYAIDNFIQLRSVKGLPIFTIVYLIAIIIQTLGTILFTRGAMTIEMNVGRDLKKRCFVHLQQLSFSYYNVTPVGYILARVMSDTNRIAGMLAWQIPDMIWQISYVIGVFISMMFLNVRLALTVMLVVPVLVILTLFFQKRILRWNREVRKQNSKITSAFNEGITGAKTSKTLVIEDQNSAEFRDITMDMRVAGVRSARLRALFIPLVLFLSSVITALVSFRGGSMVLDGILLVGTLSAFTSYAVGIFEPIQSIAANLSEAISAQANIERVFDLLDEKPMIVDTPEVIENMVHLLHQRKKTGRCFRVKLNSVMYPSSIRMEMKKYSVTST